MRVRAASQCAHSGRGSTRSGLRSPSAGAERGILDRVVGSPDSPAHHAAGVASDMTGQTVPQRVESPRAGVSSWVLLTDHLASTEAQSGRRRHETGPDTGREVPESPLTLALPGFRAGTRG